MYDVDDLLYSHPDIIPVNTDNGKTRFDNVKHITLDIMFSVCNLYLMYFGNIAPLSPCNKKRITYCYDLAEKRSYHDSCHEAITINYD